MLLNFPRLLLLVLQETTGLPGAARIDGGLVLVDVLDHTVLVHHERSPVGKAVLLIKDAVVFGNRSLEVAKKGEGDADLFGECGVGRRAVHADTQNLGTRLLELGDISLIRL
jgi:hypothetical protein